MSNTDRNNHNFQAIHKKPTHSSNIIDKNSGINKWNKY